MKVVLIPNQRLRRGYDSETEAIEIPDDTGGVQCNAARLHWEECVRVIKIQVWVSYDAGHNWHHLVGFHAGGGEAGEDASAAGRRIKPGKNRMVKVRVTVEHDIDTEISVEFY